MNYTSTFGAKYNVDVWKVNGKRSYSLGSLIAGTPDEHSHHEVNEQPLYYSDTSTCWMMEGDDRCFCTYKSAYDAAMAVQKKYTGFVRDWPVGVYTRTRYDGTVITIAHAGESKGTCASNGNVHMLAPSQWTSAEWDKE